MKNVKFKGSYDAYLPTLGLYVKEGSVIEVEDDFDNFLFEETKEVTTPEPEPTVSQGDSEDTPNMEGDNQ